MEPVFVAELLAGRDGRQGDYSAAGGAPGS